MKYSLYSLGLALLFLCPLVALGQTSYYMAWPAIEDTAMVPDGSNLPQYIFKDTVAHQASWANHTRVYVLKAGGHYDWTAACSLNVANRKLLIRGEDGKNYVIPSTRTSDYKPILQSSTASTSLFIITATRDTVCMKNVAIAGYDPSHMSAYARLSVSAGASACRGLSAPSVGRNGGTSKLRRRRSRCDRPSRFRVSVRVNPWL